MRFGNWETRALLLSSLLILDLGLVILLTRQSDVTYEQENDVNGSRELKPSSWVPDLSDSLEYLFCLNLKGEFDGLANRTEIELDDLNEELLNYFQSKQFKDERKEKFKNLMDDDMGYNSLKSILQYFQSDHEFKSLILEQLQMSNYYIIDGKICFVSQSLFDFRHKASSLSKIFLNESLYVFKLETHDLYQMSSSEERFDQAVVLNPQRHSLCAKNYNKNRCLNECFKSRFRLARYFYDGNETGPIQLDWDEQDESIQEHEQFCFDSCQDESCKSTYFLPSYTKYPKLITYIATPLISSFDFWLQLIGLLLPVVVILLFQFSAKLFNKKAFMVVLLLICLVSAVTVFFALYRQNYPDEDDCRPSTRTEKEISFRLFEAEEFSLIICIGIGNIMLGDYRPHILSNSFDSDKIKSFFQNKTLAELELETEKGFNETVESIHLDFLGKNSKVNFNLSPRVLFLANYRRTLSRCFQVDVNPSTVAYQAVLYSARLIVKFNHSVHETSLLPKNTSPNYRNLDFVRISDRISFQRNEKHLEGNCFDYQSAYPDCGSQHSCLEACVARELIDRSGRLAESSLIDKTYYDAGQWNSTKIEGTVDQKKIPKSVKILCNNKFSKTDCHSTSFARVENKKSLQRLYGWYEEKIDPYYNVVKEFEEADPPSLLSSLLIVQGVFLAFNLLRLAVIVGFLKFKVRKIKLLHSLIYAVFLIALFVHLIWAFGAAMNEKRVFSQYYETPSTTQMNDAVFCFEPKKLEEGNSSLVITNRTANHTDGVLHDQTNLRMIIREEETENETEDTNEALTVAYNATGDESNENGLRFNETENLFTNYTDSELANGHNATEAFDSFNSSNSHNLTTDDYYLTTDDQLDDKPIGLTGTLLEEWTSDLTPETVFDKISYLDKSSGKWITLNTDNFTNADLLIDSFFYEGRKCFSLGTRFDYSRQQLTFLHQQNSDVLKVHLSEWLKQVQNLTLSIATKQRSQMTFDDLYDGLYFYTKMPKRQIFDKVYSISRHELVQLTYEDRFYWTNPLAFLFGGELNLNSYYAQLLDAFRAKHQAATMRLPLQENNFDLPINDTLFDQFYEEYVQENGPPINRERPELQYSVNVAEASYKYPSPIAKHPDYDFDVKFSLSFLKKIVKQSNAGAYLQFVAYLLNALLVLMIIGLFDLLIHQII